MSVSVTNVGHLMITGELGPYILWLAICGFAQNYSKCGFFTRHDS